MLYCLEACDALVNFHPRYWMNEFYVAAPLIDILPERDIYPEEVSFIET